MIKTFRPAAPVAVVLAAAAGAAMLWATRHHNGLWIDELYTLHSINMPAGELCRERITRGHVPTWFLGMKAWHGALAAAGLAAAPTETTMRLPGMVAWAAGVGAFAALARGVLRAGPAAGLATLMFALNGISVRQAAEARMYPWSLLAAVGMTAGYLGLVGRDSRAGAPGRPRRHAALLVASTLAGAWISPTCLITAGAMAAHALLDSARRRRFGLPAAAALGAPLMAVATLAPLYIMHLGLRQRSEVAGTAALNLPMNLAALLGGVTAEGRYYQVPATLRVLAAPGAALAVAVLVAAWRRRRRLGPVLSACVAIVLLPAGAMLASWALREVELTKISLLGPGRYLLGLLPAAALLSGAMLARLTATWPRAAKHGARAGLAVFMLAAAWTVLHVHVEDFRGNVRRWAAARGPGDALVTIPHEIADGVAFYAPGARVDAAIDRYLDDPVRIEAMLAPLAATRPAVWMLTYRPRSRGRDHAPAVDAAIRLMGQPGGPDRRRVKKLGVLRLFRFAGAGTGTGAGTGGTTATATAAR